MNTLKPDAEITRRPNRPIADARGIALITTLLLLSVMLAMTLAMVIAVFSDTLITRYYRNFRSSFYAADSGLNIARQSMLAQLTAAVPTSVAGNTQPLAAGTETTVLANMNAQYGSANSINSGQAASSWPAKFYIATTPAATLSPPTCTISATTGTPTNAGPYTCTNMPACTGTAAACAGFSRTISYSYPYSFTAMGQALANEQTQLQDAGMLSVSVTENPITSVNSSFAAWGMFIDQFAICSGSDLVPGTITGPVFTNGAWTFGNSGSYTFTDKIGSVSPQFGWQSGGCSQSATYPQSGFSTTFQGGVNLGANSVPLPANSFSQKTAVVNGVGSGTATTAQMNTALKTANGSAYPASGTTTPGVYLPYTTTTSAGCPAAPCMTGGGIYVEDNGSTNVSVKLTASNPSSGLLCGIAGNAMSGHALQVVTVTQGAVITTVSFDQTANMTCISSGSTNTLVHGVPENSSSGTASPGTMVYVDGDINSLSGPGQGVSAIQDGAAMTVTSAGNVTVTGDILYNHEPVTMTANQTGPNTPVDTLIPANNYGQVLGIFTANGNVNLANTQSNGNLEIDASIATISQGGSGGIVNTGNSINTLSIVGGRIQNTIQNIGATTRNVFFDRRFASANFAPPWFPATTITPTTTSSDTSVTSTFQRTQWLAIY